MMRRRNPDSDSARIAEAQTSLNEALREFNIAAYDMAPSPGQIGRLLHSLTSISFYRGRLVELGVYGAVDDATMNDIWSEIQDISFAYLKGKGVMTKANGRTRRY